MTNKFELYKCDVCGNIIEILVSGDGHPVCCGEEMKRIEPKNDITNSPDMTEKHTPVIENNASISVVAVNNHPMVQEHYIMFLEAISKDRTKHQTKFFYPNEKVVMELGSDMVEPELRSYCNVHGLYVNRY